MSNKCFQNVNWNLTQNKFKIRLDYPTVANKNFKMFRLNLNFIIIGLSYFHLTLHLAAIPVLCSVTKNNCKDLEV